VIAFHFPGGRVPVTMPRSRSLARGMVGSFSDAVRGGDTAQAAQYRAGGDTVQSGAGANQQRGLAPTMRMGRGRKDSTQRPRRNAKIAKGVLSLRGLRPKVVSKSSWCASRSFECFALNPSCREVASSLRFSQ
jgi:hypothetical protein